MALGAFGERNEGYFDPWALLQAAGEDERRVSFWGPVSTEISGVYGLKSIGLLLKS